MMDVDVGAQANCWRGYNGSAGGRRPSAAACAPSMTSISSSLWRTLTRRALPSLAAMTLTTSAEQETNPKLRRHHRYWLDDGSLILRAQNDLYKVHRTLLERHSRLLSTIHASADLDKASNAVDGMAVTSIPDELGVASTDVEILLEHLYHDV